MSGPEIIVSIPISAAHDARLPQHAAGRDNVAIHGAPNGLGVDTVFFYFVDVGVAKAFVERLACGLAVVSSSGLVED